MYGAVGAVGAVALQLTRVGTRYSGAMAADYWAMSGQSVPCIPPSHPTRVPFPPSSIAASAPAAEILIHYIISFIAIPLPSIFCSSEIASPSLPSYSRLRQTPASSTTQI